MFFSGLKIFHNETIVANGGISNKLFWETKITIFNKTFILDTFPENLDENLHLNKIRNLNENNIEISYRTKQAFLNKKSARNELAIFILKEIDLPSYEEMLIGQESVRKTLQNYRDGVLSGNENNLTIKIILNIHFYFILFLFLFLLLFLFSFLFLFLFFLFFFCLHFYIYI